VLHCVMQSQSEALSKDTASAHTATPCAAILNCSVCRAGNNGQSDSARPPSFNKYATKVTTIA